MQIKFSPSLRYREFSERRKEGRRGKEDGSGQFHPGKYIQDWPHSHKELIVLWLRPISI
jgi:hypothetical protein